MYTISNRETNLKVKQALSEMASQFEHLSKSSDSNAINYEMSKLDCSIECEAPNELLNEFEGNMNEIKNYFRSQKCNYPFEIIFKVH